MTLGKSPDFFSFYFLMHIMSFILASLGNKDEIMTIALLGNVCNHTYGTEKKHFSLLGINTRLFLGKKLFFLKKIFQ